MARREYPGSKGRQKDLVPVLERVPTCLEDLRRVVSTTEVSLLSTTQKVDLK